MRLLTGHCPINYINMYNITAYPGSTPYTYSSHGPMHCLRLNHANSIPIMELLLNKEQIYNHSVVIHNFTSNLHSITKIYPISRLIKLLSISTSNLTEFIN